MNIHIFYWIWGLNHFFVCRNRQILINILLLENCVLKSGSFIFWSTYIRNLIVYFFNLIHSIYIFSVTLSLGIWDVSSLIGFTQIEFGHFISLSTFFLKKTEFVDRKNVEKFYIKNLKCYLIQRSYSKNSRVLISTFIW